ncbi:hypothetical protein DL96DRAFT_1825375 [Flagelloscypha sp. PMI_526]|nr:hypothetical protein DL96DRAFT_1825375 [Flagelloscypha sp. PMI_526]
MDETSQGIRVVSFDGPTLDATGLSELLILEDIAGRWTWDRDNDEREGGDVRVSELFDIVGGTGLGGFYAILFSLDMTIAQVIESHKILQTVLFFSQEWQQKNIDACVNLLDKVLAQIMEGVGLNMDLNTPFLSKNSLKCFVCVVNDLNAGCARSLRNYRVRTSKSPRCSIREAIHATLADGIHLPPVCIQDEQFINASSGFTNPSYEIMKELPLVFSTPSKLACFVNLGVGDSTTLPLTSGGSLEEQTNLLRFAGLVAQHLEALCGSLGACYFRFSVSNGVEGSALGSADGATRVVKTLTMAYLEEAKVSEHVDAAVESLVKRHGVVELKRLGSLAAEDGKRNLIAQVEAVHDGVVHMKKRMDDAFYREIKSWLTPIDQTAKLDACIRARSSSTCTWFWEHPEVAKWNMKGGIFWCHAGMGTGKTILASHVIETLMDLSDECFVAYYYFEFTNPSTLSEEALFRSIVSQLSYTNDVVSRQLYEHHKHGSLQPQLKSLHKVLREIVVTAARPVYIIIDALDELPRPGRRYLLESLLELPAADGLRVMMTSRDEVDIHESFAGKSLLDFPIRKEMVRQDIKTFVDQALAARKWQSWPKDVVLEMRNILIVKADGMFRMVAFQFEVLNQTQSTEDMWQALTCLPATLGDTYLYILNTISSKLQSRAHTLLCILSVASEPVSIVELSELLAVELGDSTDPVTLPVYREGLRYHEPQNIVGLGTALVRYYEHWYYGAVLQFAHASVKEYLLQCTCSWYALDEQLAHETTARACLAFLIHNEGLKQSKRLVGDDYLLSHHWWSHIHSNHSVQLLSQQQQLFKSFPWTNSSIGGTLTSRHPRGLIFLDSPLLFAVAAGLEQLLRTMLESSSQWTISDLNHALETAIEMGPSPGVFKLLIEKGADVNSTTEGKIPLLYSAAYSGQLRAVQILVGYGADVNMVGGKYGSALQAAVIREYLDVVEFLVESGADLNFQGGMYGSALHIAVRLRALEIVQFLVEKGADVRVVGGTYGSPLQTATKYRAFDNVEYLLEKGADATLLGGKDGSALEEAGSYESLDILELFFRWGRM